MISLSLSLCLSLGFMCRLKTYGDRQNDEKNTIRPLKTNNLLYTVLDCPSSLWVTKYIYYICNELEKIYLFKICKVILITFAKFLPIITSFTLQFIGIYLQTSQLIPRPTSACVPEINVFVAKLTFHKFTQQLFLCKF